jgi:hypothetical protein
MLKSPGAMGSSVSSACDASFNAGSVSAHKNIPSTWRDLPSDEQRDRFSKGGKYALSKLDRDSHAGNCNVDGD